MSVQSEIDRINGAKSTLANNINSAGFTAGVGASIVQLASTVGEAFTSTSSRLSEINGASGTISVSIDILESTKTNIRNAIISSGGSVPEGTSFSDYYAKIEDVSNNINAALDDVNGEVV